LLQSIPILFELNISTTECSNHVSQTNHKTSVSMTLTTAAADRRWRRKKLVHFAP